MKNRVATIAISLWAMTLPMAAEAAEQGAPKSLSDYAAIFEALTEGMTSEVVAEVKDSLDEYETQRILSGSDEDGTISWNGEVNVYPQAVENLTLDLDVVLANFAPEEESPVLNGRVKLRVTGYWNPLVCGLFNVGFPWIYRVLVDGQLSSSSAGAKPLTVNIRVDNTADPKVAEFIVNGVHLEDQLKK